MFCVMDNKKIILSDWVDLVFSTPETFSHWFGYYNYSPIDLEGNRLLVHRVDFDARAITADDVAEVGFFDLKDGSWHSLGKTNAFNWQQGSMLQWLHGEQDGNEIIYNCTKNGKFIAKIFNINKNTDRDISWPIYGVTPDGKTSITLQFERNYWCRAYHYESIKNLEFDVRVAEDDGIFSVDLETNTVKKIVSIQNVINADFSPEFSSAKHWLEHIMINREGLRFSFYHRFTRGDNFITRILTANIDGTDLYVVDGWRESGWWSHMNWRFDDEFVAYGCKRRKSGEIYDKVTNSLGKSGELLKKIYRKIIVPSISKRVHHTIATNSCYKVYKDKQGQIGEFSHGYLINDGHPSFTKDGKYMLTDTYADKKNYRRLLLFDVVKKKTYELGKFFSPYNNCSYRCDLHPRFSRDEKYIIIDSAHSGKHQMTVFELLWNKIIN